MKKRSMLLILAMLLVLVLTSCSNVNLVFNPTKNNKEETSISQVKTDRSLLVVSALSSANVLSSDLAGVTSVSNNSYLFSKDKEEVEIDMEKANSYLQMMENILANGGPVITSETESDREGYDVMMTVLVKDLAGNEKTYTIYYSIIVEEEILPELPNEEEIVPEVPGDEVVPEVPGDEVNPDVEEVEKESESSEVEATAYYRFDGHGDKDDKTDNEDKETPSKGDSHHNDWHDKANDQFKNHHYGDKEDEIEYEINALAIIDGVEYEVLGKKEVETEDDGEEVEIKFIIKLDEENYVKIEQEIEEGEVEYEYSIYQRGRKASTLKFETEEENGKTFIKLSTTENGYKETYKFIVDETHTIIQYKGNGYSYTLIVTSTTDEEGNVTYNYFVKEKDYSWKYEEKNKR